MRAARLHGPADVRIDEVDDPPDPGPDQAVVAPLWSGLCGTDVKEFTGHGGSAAAAPHPLTGACIPLILGHEFSARVVAVGSKVHHVAAGDEVVVMPLQYCGGCAACLAGRHPHCQLKAWTGLSSPWGGFGDLALVESYQLTPLDGISTLAGAVVEPAAVAMNAVVRAGIDPGDSVFVAGAGAIGALTVMAARAVGATSIYVLDPNSKRAEHAAALGAEVVPEDEPARIARFLRDRTGGWGVDVAMDCAGKPQAVAACVQAVRTGGTIGIPAVHPGSNPVDLRRVTREDLTVVGSIGYRREVWERTVGMVRAGLLPVERIVTARIERDQIVEKGFAVLAQPSHEIKVLARVNR
jgi:(R,R)-butanediol dehydrogenase/meso-butanediol dehydrogenase/diacetyl reductase